MSRAFMISLSFFLAYLASGYSFYLGKKIQPSFSFVSVPNTTLLLSTLATQPLSEGKPLTLYDWSLEETTNYLLSPKEIALSEDVLKKPIAIFTENGKVIGKGSQKINKFGLLLRSPRPTTFEVSFDGKFLGYSTPSKVEVKNVFNKVIIKVPPDERILITLFFIGERGQSLNVKGEGRIISLPSFEEFEDVVKRVWSIESLEFLRRWTEVLLGKEHLLV